MYIPVMLYILVIDVILELHAHVEFPQRGAM
jgi:hypothetical protein